MKKATRAIVAAFTIALLLTIPAKQTQAQDSRIERLRSHLYYLASDSLQGRLAGSEGAALARTYILNNYKEIGLLPYQGSFIHKSTPNQSIRSAILKSDTIFNIVAVIPGNDPVLKNEYIVLGAHYDHLGVKGGQIYNGADDNASGSSALIEIARQLYAHRNELKRTVIIAAFDAEEEGLFGSNALVNEMQENSDINRVKLMMSIDMVGWLRANEALELSGVSSLKDARKTIMQLAETQGIRVKTAPFEESIFTATDTEPFAKIGQVPTLAVTTGLKSPYHKPEDDANLIDYDGMDKICEYLSSLTLLWASNQTPLVASGHVAPKHREKLPLFEIGPSVNVGYASLRYPGSALKGKDGVGLNVGINSRININKISLRVAGYFNYAVLPTPNLFGTVYDVFSDRDEEGQKSILAPVSILYSPFPNGEFFLGGGVNYKLLLDMDKSVYNTNLWGWHWELGFRMSRIEMSFIEIFQITPYFINSTMPTVKSRQFLLNINYML